MNIYRFFSNTSGHVHGVIHEDATDYTKPDFVRVTWPLINGKPWDPGEPYDPKTDQFGWL